MQLTLHCGDYAACVAFRGEHMKVIGHTTETDQSILAYGKSIRPLKSEPVDIFSNLELILLGIRISVRRGYIRSEEVVIRYYPSLYVTPINILMNGQGAITHWPEGFFQALVDGQIELLRKETEDLS